MKINRILTAGIAGVILSLSLVGCASFAGSANAVVASPGSVTGESTDDGLNQAKVIRIGQNGTSDILYFLEEKYHFVEDEFKNDGIKIEWNHFEYGAPLVEAFAAGELDVSTALGDTPFLTAAGNGVDIVAVSESLYYPDAFKIILGPGKDAEIKSIEDLRGKKLQVQVGAATQNFAYKELKSVGLNPETDVEIVNIASFNDSLSALLNGDIDAGISLEPYGGNFVAQGCTVLDIGTPLKEYVPVHAVNREFAQKNPELTARYIKAVTKAYQHAIDNIDETKEIMAGALDLDKSSLGYIDTWEVETDISEDALEQWQATADFLQEQGILEKEIDVKNYYTTEYLDRANQLLESEE